MGNTITSRLLLIKGQNPGTAIHHALEEEDRDWQKDMGCKKGEACQIRGNYSRGERNQTTDRKNSFLQNGIHLMAWIYF